MAKFFVTFIIVAFIALESRIYVHSHPSQLNNADKNQADTISPTSIYPSASSRRHRSHAEVPTRERHHKRNAPHSQDFALKLSDEPNEATIDIIESNRLLEREREHYEHQMEHERQHRQEHERRRLQQHQQDDMDSLKTMPRIWQRLQHVHDKMYNDDDGGSSNSKMASTLSQETLSSLPNFNDYRPYSHENAEEKDINSLLPPAVPGIAAAEEQTLPLTTTTEDRSWTTPTTKEVVVLPKGCPKCESDRQVAHISEEELIRMRIDFVKQQILEKLRLKERPHVSAISLPKPISEGATIAHQDDETKGKEQDDFYARTSKKFIFLEREQTECNRLTSPETPSSMCFSFKLEEEDVEKFDVSTAVLWLFKNKQRKQNRTESEPKLRQQIVVSEVQQAVSKDYMPMVKTIAIQSVNVQDEWMQIDIMWPIKRWIGNHDLSHLIHLSCLSCDIESMEKMISVDKDYRPFIMIDMQNRRRPMRQKRSINCTNGVTECCREKMYISFDEIGWGDWIIQPRGYDAYFCRGTCASVASVSQSLSHHASFVQKSVWAQRAQGQKPLEMVLCCSAKEYSPLQFMYLQKNNTAIQGTLPNMIVESCGCR